MRDIAASLYASSNALRFIDQFGLVSFVGFPANREQEARQALDRAKQTLKDDSCCTGDKKLTEKLLRRLNSSNLVIEYDEQLQVCGRTPASAVLGLRKKFKVGPGARNCCIENLSPVDSLASTFVHEASHFFFGGEDRAQGIEEDCFGCSVSPRQ